MVTAWPTSVPLPMKRNKIVRLHVVTIELRMQRVGTRKRLCCDNKAHRRDILKEGNKAELLANVFGSSLFLTSDGDKSQRYGQEYRNCKLRSPLYVPYLRAAFCKERPTAL